MRALSSMVRYSCTMRDDMLHYRDCRRVGPCLSALVCRAWLAIGLLGFFVIGGAIAQALHWPLPWMIGSLTLVAIFSIGGMTTGTPRVARRSR